jgi:hypothetical protein
MKKIFLNGKNIALMALVALSLPSCLKSNDATYTDFSQAGTTVSLLNSGAANLKAANINIFNGDSTIVDLTVQYNGEFAPTSDVPVKLEVKDSRRTAYLLTNTAVPYEAMLAAMYKVGPTSLIIKGGERLVKSTVTIYHNAVKAQPLSKSWMLPIELTDASGRTIASNFQTMYINIIGNPWAGNFKWFFRRWNITTGLSSAEPAIAPNGGTINLDPKAVIPKDAVTVFMTSGYFIQPDYEFSFTNNGGVLSNYKARIEPGWEAQLNGQGVTVVDGPNVLAVTYNPAAPAGQVKRYAKLQYQVFNGTAWRYLIDEYTDNY